MKFTLVMLGVPFMILLVEILRVFPAHADSALGMTAAIWLWLDIPLLGFYWLVRVARLAWRHGERA